MLRDEENYVALFIDWDNLAISTAADFGGATPDVRALIRVAQRYGTILLARAYAEWQVPSDRLAVYRSGIEPVYAPTFRFEPEPAGGRSGKSLADPCLVADCVDLLHLMPSVTHFMLVSGDKDLIPIVRLAQLRGRKVIVVGPDYVAAILRDMADEYISYRSLVESGETHSTPDQIHAGAGGPRRRGGRPVATARVVSAPAPALPTAPFVPAFVPPAQPPPSQPMPAQPTPTQPTPTPAPVRRESFRDRPERGDRGERQTQPRQPLLDIAGPRDADVDLEPAAEVALSTPGEAAEAEALGPESTASPEEVKALWATITGILRERESQGKPRLRATNLKDLLMARMAGFNERHFGYHRFRDLLAAAEKDGAVEVNRSGPVHWVTLPSPSGQAAPSIDEPRPAEAAPIAPVAEPPTAAPAAPVVAETDLDLVRFVVDLRNRSRWLTYTYVLTNLISHLSQQIQPQQADSDARNALNRLVQQGVLRVDREPREIEVAGARHRVRMCHIEESHPLVQAVLAAPMEEAPPAAPVAEAPAPESAPISQPEREAPIREVRDGREPRQGREAREPGDGRESRRSRGRRVAREGRETREPLEVREPRESREPRGGRAAQPPRVILPFLQPSIPPAPEPAAVEPQDLAEGGAEAPTPTPAPQPAAVEPPRPAPWLAPLPDALLAPSASVELAPLNLTGTPAAIEAPIETASADEPAAPAQATAPEAADSGTPLVLAFEALREIIRGATGPDKPFAGAASVKTRLARQLGTFDERTLGFGKFKDFLLAAERGGYVRVESIGPATRVRLPDAR